MLKKAFILQIITKYIKIMHANFHIDEYNTKRFQVTNIVFDLFCETKLLKWLNMSIYSGYTSFILLYLNTPLNVGASHDFSAQNM